MAADGLEMPCNPHLSQSAWSGSHRNNFAQASSPLPGLTGNIDQANIEHVSTDGPSVILTFTEPDSEGRQAVWSSTVGRSSTVYKLDKASLKNLGSITSRGDPTNVTGSVSGAYNILDRSQNFIVGRAGALQVFGDSQTGNRHSGVSLLKEFSLPATAKCTSSDELVGITMLPDGHVAFATKFGNVGVIPRYVKAMCTANLKVFSINGNKCTDPSVDPNTLEQVSNSIAADEKNNIYVVTSGAQHRINWDGASLSSGWKATYAGAGGTGSGRLGSGSGSTPTLMGTRKSDDKFVVITDAQQLMHVVYMWRDDIPADWKPIRPDADRRIACEVPVNFGDPNVQESLSEQSVLVRGYASVIVNNLFQQNALFAPLPSNLQPYTQIFSGLSFNKPTGLQRVDWDPKTRTCKTTWTNRDVSWPNGIPTMSASSQQIFGIGSRNINGIDTWTLESVDFNSGKTKFVLPSTAYPTDNSFYAATTIGPEGTVWTGTLYGVTRFTTCDASTGAQCGVRASNPLSHLPVPKAP